MRYTKCYVGLIFWFCGLVQLTAQESPNNCIIPEHENGFPSAYEAAYELFQPVIKNAKLFGYKVSKQGKHGFIDANNNPILPLVYDRIFQLGNQHYTLQKGNTYQVYNPETGYLSPETYDKLPEKERDNPYIQTSQNGKLGALLLNGLAGEYKKPKELPCRYEAIKYLGNISFKPEQAAWAVKTNQKWSFLNHNMETLGTNEYDSVWVWDDLYENYADGIRVLDKGKYGFLDISAKSVLPCEYERLGDFLEEIAIVQKGGKWGIVRMDNTPLLPFLYDTLIFEETETEDLLLIAQKSQKWAFMVVENVAKIKAAKLDFVYDQLLVRDENGYSPTTIMYAQKAGKWGIIDEHNKQIYPFWAEARTTSAGRPWYISKNTQLEAPEYELDLFYKGERIEYCTLPAHISPKLYKAFQNGLMKAGNSNANPYFFGTRRTRVLSEKIIAVQDEQFWGLVDAKTGEKLLPIRYDSIRALNPYFLIAYQKGQKKMYVWNLKNVLVEFLNKEKIESFETLEEHNNSTFVRTVKNGKFGVLNIHTGVSIPPMYEQIETAFDIGAFAVKQNGKWGLIDFFGKEYISPSLGLDTLIASTYWEIEEVFLSGKKNAKWGLLDKTGQLLLGWEYDTIPLLQESNDNWFFICQKNGQILFLDKNYRQMGTDTYDRIEDAPNRFGVFVIQKNQKFGFWDMQAGLLVPPTYDFLKMAGEQAFICKKDGKFGLLDAKNNQILPFIYDTIQTATNSHVVVEQAGKLSFLEIPTDVVVPKNQRLDRDEQQIPREKWYIFQTLNGKCFFMNPIPKALSIGVGYDSLLQKTGLHSNTHLLSKISQNEKMYFAAFKNGKWGLVDIANTVILPFEYEQIGEVLSIHETISVKKDGKWGLVGMNGQPLTEFLASESPLLIAYPETEAFFFQKQPNDKTPTRGWRLMLTTQIWTPFSYE